MSSSFGGERKKALQNSMKPQITAALFFSLRHNHSSSTCLPHPVLRPCERERQRQGVGDEREVRAQS